MTYPDSILFNVTKPARYTGGEWNSVVKDWQKTDIKFVLSYPDIYEIGMSIWHFPYFTDTEQAAGCACRSICAVGGYGCRN